MALVNENVVYAHSVKVYAVILAVLDVVSQLSQLCQERWHLQEGKQDHTQLFFVKAMELLNEGGLLAFVTSRGVADATGNQFVREYLVNHANLITALRLPDDLFMQTGGIEVGSDLLIFQKNTRKMSISSRERMFTETMQETVDAQGTATEYFNKYFTLPNTSLSTESRIAAN